MVEKEKYPIPTSRKEMDALGWKEADIISQIPAYQINIQTLLGNLAKKDENIKEADRKKGKTINLSLSEKLKAFEHGNTDAYQGLEHFMASYLVFGKHSEDNEILQWKTPEDLENYLKGFKQHFLLPYT